MRLLHADDKITGQAQQTAKIIVDQPHIHALGGLAAEDLLHTVPHFAGTEDKKFQKDELFRLFQIRQQLGIHLLPAGKVVGSGIPPGRIRPELCHIAAQVPAGDIQRIGLALRLGKLSLMGLFHLLHPLPQILGGGLVAKSQIKRAAQQGQQKLFRWVRRRFAAMDKEIDDNAVEHLLFTCGSLMDGLVPEIAKIGAYAKGKRITVADIDAVADPVLDAEVFQMTDAVAAGKYDRAAELLAELLRMQEEPIRILAALGKMLRQLYTARLAIDGGKDRVWLKDLWRMKSDYPARKLLDSARNVGRDWCREAVKRCQVLDRRMKSERNMDSEGELKLLLMELAGAR